MFFLLFSKFLSYFLSAYEDIDLKYYLALPINTNKNILIKKN